MKRRELDLKTILRGSVTVGVLVVIWYLITLDLVPKIKFPRPSDVLNVIFSINTIDLAQHAASTLLRVVAGWAAGCFLGIRMGVLMSRSRRFKDFANPIVEAIRPIPPIALIPFFIAWFGIEWYGQVILIALGCFMVMTVNTMVAVNNVAPRYIEASRLLGSSIKRIFKTVVRPAIRPDLLSGLRIASALAFAIGVAGELMGAQSGLGFMIMVARQSLATDTILLSIVFIALEAVLVDWVIRLVNKRSVEWSESSEESLVKIIN